MKDSEHPYFKQKIASFNNGCFILSITWDGARISCYTLSEQPQPFHLDSGTMSKCLCNLPPSEEDKGSWLWLSMTQDERRDFLRFMDEVDMVIYHLKDMASLNIHLSDYRQWMTIPMDPDTIDDLRAKLLNSVIDVVNKKIEAIDIDKVKAECRYAGEARTKKIEEIKNKIQALRLEESALNHELDSLNTEAAAFEVKGEK